LINLKKTHQALSTLLVQFQAFTEVHTFIDLIYLRMNRINETIEASTLILTQLERLTNELAFELARIEE